MNRELLDYLCEPVTKNELKLVDENIGEDGQVTGGFLESPSGKRYPIINGIPRFLPEQDLVRSVKSFGDEWNYFNFIDFKANWLEHTVAHTFGSTDVFKDAIIVDAGGGSGSQTLWMLESGAKYVIMLELSDSVDDVVQRNLGPTKFRNYDVVQCSIDQPPIKDNCIDGIVICHNVIQHTPSVENTAEELYRLVAPGGEFVFNCYPRNDEGLKNWIRFHVFNVGIRRVVSRFPFTARVLYSKSMGILRFVPILGFFLEKLHFCVTGIVPRTGSLWTDVRRKYRATVVNTFDAMGSHKYQHHKSNDEIRALVNRLQPNSEKVMNTREYFAKYRPVQCALRLFK